MSRARLDQTDLRIIEHLQQDGRRPYTEIARDLGLSEANVRQRTKRLVRLRVISIVAVADAIGLGFGLVGSIGVKVSGRARNEVAEQIGAFPEVVYLVVCTGPVDLLVEVVCRDHGHFLEMIERMDAILGADVAESRIYLKTVKESERWLAHLAAGMFPSNRSSQMTDIVV
jgi:Lrp/AsnC family transcriptional regulator for asnA, asnC and gidA